MIRAKQEPKEIVIDLTGPQGNAFYLLGTAKDFCSPIRFRLGNHSQRNDLR
jgi:hypothetical protein